MLQARLELMSSRWDPWLNAFALTTKHNSDFFFLSDMIPDFLIWSSQGIVHLYHLGAAKQCADAASFLPHLPVFSFSPKPVDKVSTASFRYHYRIPARSMTRIRYLSSLSLSRFFRHSKSDASSHESSKREAGEQSRKEVLWCICTWRAVAKFCITPAHKDIPTQYCVHNSSAITNAICPSLSVNYSSVY